jgi:hypothetical protein
MLDGSMLLYSDQREGGHRFPMGHGSLGGRMQRRRYEKACGSPLHGRLLPDPRAPAFSVASHQTSTLSRSTSDNITVVGALLGRARTSTTMPRMYLRSRWASAQDTSVSQRLMEGRGLIPRRRPELLKVSGDPGQWEAAPGSCRRWWASQSNRQRPSCSDSENEVSADSLVTSRNRLWRLFVHT